MLPFGLTVLLSLLACSTRLNSLLPPAITPRCPPTRCPSLRRPQCRKLAELEAQLIEEESAARISEAVEARVAEALASEAVQQSLQQRLEEERRHIEAAVRGCWGGWTPCAAGGRAPGVSSMVERSCMLWRCSSRTTRQHLNTLYVTDH